MIKLLEINIDIIIALKISENLLEKDFSKNSSKFSWNSLETSEQLI